MDKPTKKEIDEASIRQFHNIQVGIDGTDHIVFFCPECKGVLQITKVKTYRNIYCTHIILYCKKCKKMGQRKFYWYDNGTVARFCVQRTDKLKKHKGGKRLSSHK